MKHSKHLLSGVLAVGLASAGPTLAAADTVYMKEASGEFADVWLQVQDAVQDRGFVIDYMGNVGGMLDRTASVSSSGSKVPYKNARYLQFCSSKLTHEAVAVDINNIAMCPLVVFAYESTQAPGKVMVGFGKVTGAGGAANVKELAKTNALLESIVNEATE